MCSANYFYVESSNENEALYYRSIISDVLSDLRLSSSINGLKSIIIPEKSLFILLAILKKSEQDTKISDICNITENINNSIPTFNFEIEKEKYISNLTEYLWC